MNRVHNLNRHFKKGRLFKKFYLVAKSASTDLWTFGNRQIKVIARMWITERFFEL